MSAVKRPGTWTEGTMRHHTSSAARRTKRINARRQAKGFSLLELTLVLAIIVAIEWNRDDQRKAKRRDRDAERTGDRELREYNEMLERIAERDRTAAR